MARTDGDVYWKLFVRDDQRDLLLRRLSAAGLRAVASPSRGAGFCYVEVTASDADANLRRVVRGCMRALDQRLPS